ncbi:MAG: cytoplasmic protein [Proteobacteria bacterium]|nr:cytoplasmic protein [Pseudomonadota bacterium]
MLFGLNRTTDEQSLITFLRQFSDDRLTRELVPRMSEEEIHQLVDLLTQIMRNHLSGDEYHRLFLGEEHHHH